MTGPICRTHCPTPSGFPWHLLLAVAAAALALWGIGHLLQAVGKPTLALVAASALFGVAAMVGTFIHDAITTTPRHIRRPRRSETTTPAIAPAQPVEVEPAAYPPLALVHNTDTEEGRAA